MLEKRRWQSLGEHKALGYAAWVKEFFANMVEEEGNKLYVRGKMDRFHQRNDKWIVQSEGAERWLKIQKEPEYQKIVDQLTDEKGQSKETKKTLYESISIGDLTYEAKLWFYFISSVLLPSRHLNTVRRNKGILLYALLKGYKISVGKIIENSILSYSRRKCRGLIPHPATITSLAFLKK